MRQQYRAKKITQIGNSKGVKPPKALALSLDTTEVSSEAAAEVILIKPASEISPLSQWAAIFAATDISAEPEFNDWDVTLEDPSILC